MRAEVMTHTNLGVPSLEIDSHRCTATFRSWETKSSELSGETTLLEGGRERWWCQVLLLNLPECLLGLFQLLDAKVRSKMIVFSATRERWRRLWTSFSWIRWKICLFDLDRLECVTNQVMSDLFEHAVQGLANLRRCAHVGQSLVVESGRICWNLKNSVVLRIKYRLVSKAQISGD